MFGSDNVRFLHRVLHIKPNVKNKALHLLVFYVRQKKVKRIKHISSMLFKFIFNALASKPHQALWVWCFYQSVHH